MSAVFLRGAGVDLHPFEPEDEPGAAAAPWRLVSRGGTGEALAMAARAPGGDLLGLLRLEGIDWVAREAHVALRWAGPEAAAAEALRLGLHYAFHELGLRLVEARAPPGDDGAAALLAGAGFEGGPRWVRRPGGPP